MVKVEKLQDEEMMQMVQFAQQMQITPEELVNQMEEQAAMYGEDEETAQYIETMRSKLAVMEIMEQAYSKGNFSEDHLWIRHLSYNERQTLRKVLPKSDPEPDFYYMTREKFSHWHIVLGYLIFFAIVFMHMRHAFPSAFQTLGLNNYKYNNIIEILGRIYTWLVCMGFAIVPILVYIGL